MPSEFYNPDRQRYLDDQWDAQARSQASGHMSAPVNNWQPPTFSPSSQPLQAPAQWSQPQQMQQANRPGSYQAGAGAAYLFHFIFWSSYVIGGWLGVKAGKNHLNRGLPMSEAVAKGINAGRRWTGWILATWLMGFLGLWAVNLIGVAASDLTDYNGGIRLWAISLSLSGLVLWPLMLVIYNRNIDQSLFKRRALYHLVAPLARRLDRFSSITLYLMIPVVPYAIAIPLNVLGVV